MKINNTELEIVCGPTSALPSTDMPEIAFAGRSNVGKSSLINKLVNRKALARTSGKPGKTQTINFYNVNKQFYLVDLPGYGYAAAAKTEQAKWAAMIERYLKNSKQLRAIFILVDIRHEAKSSDIMMCEWAAAYGKRIVIVATKADKISKGAAAKQLKLLRDGLKPCKGSLMIPFSSVTGEGKDEIWNAIEEALSL